MLGNMDEHGSWKHEAPTRIQGIARIAEWKGLAVSELGKTAEKQQLEVKYNPANLKSQYFNLGPRITLPEL